MKTATVTARKSTKAEAIRHLMACVENAPADLSPTDFLVSLFASMMHQVEPKVPLVVHARVAIRLATVCCPTVMDDTLPPDHIFTCGRLYASTVVEAVGTLNKLLHFYPHGGEDEMRYYISIGDAIETLGYCISACVEGTDKHLAAEIAGALMGATAHASTSTATSDNTNMH